MPTITRAELRTAHSPGTRIQVLGKRLHHWLGTINQLMIDKIGYTQQWLPIYYCSTTRGRPRVTTHPCALTLCTFTPTPMPLNYALTTVAAWMAAWLTTSWIPSDSAIIAFSNFYGFVTVCISEWFSLPSLRLLLLTPCNVVNLKCSEMLQFNYLQLIACLFASVCDNGVLWSHWIQVHWKIFQALNWVNG